MFSKKLFSAILLLALSLDVKAQYGQPQPSASSTPTTPQPASTPLTGNYPPLDTPPPPVASWTALVDQSKLPNAPVRTVGEACPAVDTFCDWSCTTCLRPASDFSFCPNKGDWALTYDDGPTNNTLTVLDALNSRGLKATFFAIGSRVFENPQILKQVVAAGHQVGVHTWSHTPLTTQTTEEIIAEVKWTEMAIKQAVGLTPKWFRAPGGDCDDRVRGILTQLGYKFAFWDRDTFDWESNSDPTYDLDWITQNFTIWVQNKTSPTGFATLEHDAFTRSSSKAPAAMDIVLKAGFNPQSVAVCTGDKQPYVENVTLPKSNIVSSSNSTSTTASNSTTTKTNGTTTGTGANMSAKKNGSGSVEKNVLLGLSMMILGFIGSV